MPGGSLAVSPRRLEAACHRLGIEEVLGGLRGVQAHGSVGHPHTWSAKAGRARGATLEAVSVGGRDLFTPPGREKVRLLAHLLKCTAGGKHKSS